MTNKLEDFHVTNLSPFEYDPLIVDPRKVANADQDMFDIIEIIKHSGLPNRRANMTFYVKWSDGDETWEPWSILIPREFFDTLIEI